MTVESGFTDHCTGSGGRGGGGRDKEDENWEKDAERLSVAAAAASPSKAGAKPGGVAAAAASPSKADANPAASPARQPSAADVSIAANSTFKSPCLAPLPGECTAKLLFVFCFCFQVGQFMSGRVQTRCKLSANQNQEYVVQDYNYCAN